MTDAKTPWHLPFKARFTLISKITITHVAKSKCKLAIHTAITWQSPQPFLIAPLITKRALEDLSTDALDLIDICSDQVRRLGAHSRTRKAITIFGPVGQLTSPLSLGPLPRSPTAPRIARHTLPSLVSELLLSLLESVLSTLMLAVISLLRLTAKTISAHTLLLLALALSLSLNTLSANLAAQSWWSDRRAVRFMARMGVGPDTVMAKAVYVRDMVEVSSPGALAGETNSTKLGTRSLPAYLRPAPSNGGGATEAEAENESPNPCYDAFAALLDSAMTGHSAAHLGHTQRSRWIDARDGIARKRHDLLVGLRMVDAVEREVVRAGWEEWIEDEAGRCEATEGLIMSADGEEGQGAVMDEVRAWYREYCGSCVRERGRYDL